MGGVLPTESNINMTGAGLVGKSTSGAGKSGRMSQSSVLSWLGLSASGVTDGKALIASSNSLAWSPSAAALLPDTLPAVGTLLSYGGSRQLAAGGTVSHSGAFALATSNYLYLSNGAITGNYMFTGNTVVFGSNTVAQGGWNSGGMYARRLFIDYVNADVCLARASASTLGVYAADGATPAAITAGAVTASGKFTNAVGTITADTPATITQTWNNSGVNFTGLLTNVTDTSSASYSLLMDLQSSGSSIFSVRRAYIGGTKYNRAVVWTPQYSYITQANGGFVAFGTNETTVNVAVDVGVGSGIRMASGSCVAHVNDSSNVPSGSVDLAYGRDSAGVFGIYTSTAKTIKGSLACGAITASGPIVGVGTIGNSATVSGMDGFDFSTTPGTVLIRQGGTRWVGLKSIGAVFANAGGIGFAANGAASAFTSAVYEVSNGWRLQADSGLSIRNLANSAAAALTCGAITASGAVMETPTQSSINPTTVNIPSGQRRGWYNSTLAEFRDWVNIGGTLLKSAAYT